MKKIIIVLACLSFLGVSISAQAGRKTRPRIVQSPSQPQKPNDSGATKSAPVLRSETNSANETDEPPPLPNRNDAPVEDDEIVKIETNLVTMPVTVLDRGGRFVANLEQKDFKIFENNVEQPVGFFARVETPFTVILMLDVSPSTQYQIDEIQDAAISFVNQLRRDDRVMVLSFDDKVKVLSRPTSDRNVLRNAIQRARFGDGTSLYDAVDYVVNKELPSFQGRKAVVLFTDGVDTTSRRSGYQSTVREIEEVDALFFPIRYDTYGSYSGSTQRRSPMPRGGRNSGGLGGILADILGGVIQGSISTGNAGSSRAEYETGRRYLEDLARNSGGRNFEANANNNLDSAFAGIAEELRQQYSIGYYPKEIGQKGERKSVRVRVMRPNLVVRAKTSYIVGNVRDNKFAEK